MWTYIAVLQRRYTAVPRPQLADRHSVHHPASIESVRVRQSVFGLGAHDRLWRGRPDACELLSLRSLLRDGVTRVPAGGWCATIDTRRSYLDAWHHTFVPASVAVADAVVVRAANGWRALSAHAA